MFLLITIAFTSTLLLSAQKSGGRGSHLGGTMSCIEILISLYYSNILMFKAAKPDWEDRDRILIGKGHAHLALYHIWADLGFISKKMVDTYGEDGAILGTQLEKSIPGSEYNTGSLGHVIGIGAGVCISARIENKRFKTIALIGDGECDSGSIWESIKFASDQKLNNLIVIIYMNRLSEMQILKDDQDKDLKAKLETFGWQGFIINGHSYKEINEKLKILKNDISEKPKFLIANTIKGKGVSFMENKVEWHHKAPKPDQFKKALQEYEWG